MRVYSISYKRNDVFQSINVIANNAEQAESYFKEHTPDAIICGGAQAISEAQSDRDADKGKPFIMAKI